MKSSKNYIICEACGKEYDPSLEFCPNCKLKPNRVDEVCECTEHYARLETTDKESEKYSNKQNDETSSPLNSDKTATVDFILYTFGIILIFYSFVSEEITTLNKRMLIIFSLSLFKFTYRLFFIKIKNESHKLYFRLLTPVAVIIIWLFFIFTQSKNEYVIPKYDVTTKVATIKITKNITTTNTKVVQSKTHLTTKKTNTTQPTTTTTAKKDFLVRLYYSTNLKEYKDYWMNKGESFTFPVNSASRSKTEKGVLYLYPNPDHYTKYETYKSYITYEPDGWMYNRDKNKKFENNQTIIIDDSAIFVPHFNESVECAKIKEPTREGYTFIGWSATPSGKGDHQITEWCGYSDAKGVKWYGIWSKND